MPGVAMVGDQLLFQISTFVDTFIKCTQPGQQ